MYIDENLTWTVWNELRTYRLDERLFRRAARFVGFVYRRRYDASGDHWIVIGIGAPLAAKELVIVQRLPIGNEEDGSGLRDALGLRGSAEEERKS